MTHTVHMSIPIAAYLAGLGVKVDVHADPAVREGEAYFLAPEALELGKPIEPLQAVKLATYLPISEQAMTFPDDLRPASAEEMARLGALAQARRAHEDARHAQLLAAGGVVAAVAGLHSPDENRDCGECQNGDFMASWPCTTWTLLDEQVPR